MKECRWCGQEKALTEFYRHPKGKAGLRPECKECTAASRKRWYEKNREQEVARVGAWQRDNRDRANATLQRFRERNPDWDREQHLKRTFGLSIADYDAMLARQRGGCAICERAPCETPLHVDHDHGTGAIRGLLCFQCNNAIGLFGEDPANLTRAAEYLENPPERLHSGGAEAV